ncbi:MAG: ribonuclease Y [bacterium]
MELITIIISILTLVIGIITGYFIRVVQREKSLKNAESTSKSIIEDGRKSADAYKKELIEQAKEIAAELRNNAEADIKERKNIVIELENKLTQREESLDRRSVNMDRREDSLDLKEGKLDDKKAELEQLNIKVDELLVQQNAKLQEIGLLSETEAKELIMEKVRNDLSVEITLFIKEEEEKAKAEVNSRAKNILSLAIQKYASETSVEKTVTVVSLPADEMKGRIIGREGRNIRTLESLTGVDLIIDDTPDAVILSGFDPIRRQVAKKALETLVSDGRIHPARIEEIVERSRQEVEMLMREKGDEAVFKAQIGKVHPDMIKLLGRLHYRTSYGQNVLLHSLETAFLAAKMAAEIGEDETLARRAGLFHDIGKAVDHEVEGSHVEIGVELAARYREPREVIDAIASHHGDKPAESVIAVLVAAADALSSARPGARSDSLENYVKRLQELEAISNSIPGVSESFAIQAGREVRVVVKPDEVDDASTFAVARKIKEKIEDNLSYPGTIKVTVIRETRAIDVAK